MYTVELVAFESFSPIGDKQPSTVFLNSRKGVMAWKIVRPEEILFADKKDVPLLPNQFETLPEALAYLKIQQPQLVTYSSPRFDDKEAQLLCDFINECSSLIYIKYHYNSTGGYAYRQAYNKLTDVGYRLLTQAMDMNPRMIGCAVGNHHISKDLLMERQAIVQRNLHAFNIQDPIARSNAYAKIYEALKLKYQLPQTFGSQAALTQMPTLKDVMKFEVQRHAQKSSMPLENLGLDLLSELQPPTVALAQEMERLSLLRSPEAKRIELLFIWKTLHQDVKPLLEASNSTAAAPSAPEEKLPYFYCPPGIK